MRRLSAANLPVGSARGSLENQISAAASSAGCKERRDGYRLRIGNYRVIFDEDAATILAIYIGRRATPIYKRS